MTHSLRSFLDAVFPHRHQWAAERASTPRDLDTCFMVTTGGAISIAEYRARVARVTDPVLRAQMESGDWATHDP